MTKEAYLDMCQQLGSKPKASEIPLEYDDFSHEVHTAMMLWSVLRDDWDYFNGNYFGKNMQGITEVFTLYDIPKAEQRDLFEIIMMIDLIKTRQIQSKKANKTPPKATQ